ncbi:Catenin alpha-3 [Microtus ochrogaster]|uniref:Catenin alpha-3 n=1 Tax=Microtus ochrogaster TaxID=79684 RepID=A0A8J6GV28_MICOH|nr:Catenin alpha-3 [Microtus ochrogaster]
MRKEKERRIPATRPHNQLSSYGIRRKDLSICRTVQIPQVLVYSSRLLSTCILLMLPLLPQGSIQDLKSPAQRDEIAGARAALKENSPLLHSICSACLEHSDVASLKASKDTVCEEIQNALDVISNASQGIPSVPATSEPQGATLGSALDELENLIVLNPLTVTEEEIRPSLEKRLEAIISGAALLADSSCTRDFHRERIIAECNAIRQALQDLLSEYMSNVGDWLLFLLVSSWNEFERLLRCYKGGGDFWKVTLRVASVAFSAGGLIFGVWKVEVIIGEICVCGCFSVGEAGLEEQNKHCTLIYRIRR